MKNRKAVVITLVTLVIVCAVVLTILILAASLGSNTGTQTPASYVSSYPDHIVTPGDGSTPVDYRYALINTNDNIKLKTALGQELLINIDTKKWNDIQWSASGSYVSVLGETESGVFNIFVYNLSTQIWIQATLFEGSGVTSYKWIDNDTILFTQDGWLHKYKYSSLNEIVKILQINATIVGESSNGTTILLMDSTGTFEVVGIDGKLLFTLDKITVQPTDGSTADNTVLKITKVYYDQNSQDLLFITDANKFYKWSLGSPTAKEVQILNDDGFDKSKLTLLCSQEVGIYKSYTTDGNALNFFNLDSKQNNLDSITNKSLNSSSTASGFYCDNSDQVEFKISITDQNNWYELQSGKIVSLVTLNEAKEVAFKN